MLSEAKLEEPSCPMKAYCGQHGHLLEQWKQIEASGEAPSITVIMVRVGVLVMSASLLAADLFASPPPTATV